MMETLTDHQQKVRDAFDKKDTDIDIAVLYTRVYGDPGHLSARDMQMKLAPTFAAINDKLLRGRIVPGDVKRTYRFSVRGA
jgi:hypothetical protein